MFSFHGLSENMKLLVLGARQFAQEGVYPPIRRDKSSLTARFADWARPSRIGKWTRLTARERGGQFASHKKRVAVAKGVSAIDAHVLAAVGLTVFTGGTALAGLGATGAIVVVVKCLETAYKKYKHHQADERSGSSSTTGRIRGLLGMLNYGDIDNLARRTEKAIDHEKKFRRERAQGTRFPSCVEAIRLAWRYERWYKRVEESIANHRDYLNLCEVNNGLQDICCDAVCQMSAAGVELVKYFGQTYEPKHGAALQAGMTAAIPDEGYYFWDEWFEAVSKGSEDRALRKEDLQKVLNDARNKSGISSGVLAKYTEILRENKATGADALSTTGQKGVSTLAEGALGQIMSGHFSSMISQVGSASASSVASALGSIGLTAGVSALASIGTELWNDRHNMKALSSETGGSELEFTDRVFMLKHILENGRLERLSGSLGKLATDLEELNHLKDAIQTFSRLASSCSAESKAAAEEEAKDLAVAAYRAHKHLLEILTLGIWVSRLVSEIGGMLIEMIEGREGLKNSEDILKNQLMDLDQLGHDNCKGTCYGTGPGAEWYPLNGTEAARVAPPEEIEMVELGHVA